MKKQSGQILIISVIFMSVMVVLAAALFGYVGQNVVATRRASSSEQALQLADAGIEKAIWQLNETAGAYTGETGTVLGATGVFDVSVADVSGGNKEITVTSYAPNKTNPTITRQVKVQVAGSGVSGTSFGFGIFAGAGGINMSNGTINGDVYSNDDINGTGVPAIHGSVTVAGSGGLLTGSYSQGFQAGESGGYVYAHTVNKTLATGELRCKSGSGNNKACVTTYDDPAPASFPIPQSQIDQWLSDAAAGGTISGNYSVTGIQQLSLGPKLITGNLTTGNSGILTITGTVHVQGNLITSGASRIKLASSYGAESGVLIVDGYSSIGNSTSLGGSGQAGSYILLLDTSTCAGSCSGHYAIEITGAAGTVILYAANGTLSLQNSGRANAGYAKRVEMSGAAVVNYDPVLASPIFSGGGSGGIWMPVRGTWRETK